MTRVFIDVGGHYGESVFKALDPRLDFNRIISFEPSTEGCKRIARILSDNVQVEPYGLGDSEETTTLFGAGYLGGSIFHEKITLQSREITETIVIRNAASVLRSYLIDFDECFLKLNCEGSEIAVLKSLASENLLGKFESIYVDWDAQKIPELRGEIPKTIQLLEQSEANWVDARNFEKSGWNGVEYWLEPYRNRRVKLFAMVGFWTCSFLPLQFRVEHLIKSKFPVFAVWLAKIRNKIRN